MGSSDFRHASDNALVIAVGRWQREALEEIYRRHGGALYGLASRVCGNRTKADDVMQEVFLQLWGDPTKFDASRGTLRSYLSVQIHSRSVDMLRSDTARKRREDADTTFELVVDELEREVVDLEVNERVKAALEQLPEPERAAIDLAYFQGKTYREAAGLLNEPEGTVKSRIRSGLRRLRSTLAGAVEETA